MKKTALIVLFYSTYTLGANTQDPGFCAFGGQFSNDCEIGISEDGFIQKASNQENIFEEPESIGAMGGSILYNKDKEYWLINENYSRSKTMLWVRFTYADRTLSVHNVYGFSIFDGPGIAPFWEGFECRVHDAVNLEGTELPFSEAAMLLACGTIDVGDIVIKANNGSQIQLPEGLKMTLPVVDKKFGKSSATYIFEETDIPFFKRIKCIEGCLTSIPEKSLRQIKN